MNVAEGQIRSSRIGLLQPKLMFSFSKRLDLFDPVLRSLLKKFLIVISHVAMSLYSIIVSVVLGSDLR